MKVRELIEALSKLNPELDIVVRAHTEGLDNTVVVSDATIDRIEGNWINPDGSEVAIIQLPDGMYIDDTTHNGTPNATVVDAAIYMVLVETNTTNAGDPAKRAISAENEEHAADLVLWLYYNGISAKVVTFDEYTRKLKNYQERVAAAA